MNDQQPRVDALQRLRDLVEQATPGPASVECDDSGLYVLLGDLKGDDEHLAVYAAPYNDGAHSSSRRVADARVFALAPLLARDVLELADLCETVLEVWEPLTGECDNDCECVAHPLRAALSTLLVHLDEQIGDPR